MSAVPKPRQAFKPHPILGWALSPNAKILVPFRDDILQTIGPDGWRHVPDPIGPTRMTVAVYGCSFTYGTGLADDETFVANLQLSLDDARVVNKGVGGYGTLQNYLQFRQDVKRDEIDVAVFGVISDHRFRNIAHPQRMQQHLKSDWYELGIEHVPRVRQDRRGFLIVDYVSIWQPSLLRKDFDVFLPDDHMIDQATLCVFKAISALAAQHKIPIIFALLDQLDPEFNRILLQEFPEAIDISTQFDENHTFMPQNIHPNVFANSLFSTRLLSPISKLCEEISGNS